MSFFVCILRGWWGGREAKLVPRWIFLLGVKATLKYFLKIINARLNHDDSLEK